MGDGRSEWPEMAALSAGRRRKPKVLVTGFGPFGEHAINASWEAVQQLRNFGDLTDSVELVTEQIPVIYSEVINTVPSLWTKHNPDLVIHCGVSALIAWKNVIQIERNAHSYGYVRPDVLATTPCDGCYHPKHGERCLSTLVDLDGIIQGESDRPDGCALICQASEDAGRYLCEFIYYTSLSIQADRTLFIHVPPLDKPFSAREIARAIKRVIVKIVHREKVAVEEAIPAEAPLMAALSM